jgi:hypothetical protein
VGGEVEVHCMAFIGVDDGRMLGWTCSRQSGPRLTYDEYHKLYFDYLPGDIYCEDSITLSDIYPGELHKKLTELTRLSLPVGHLQRDPASLYLDDHSSDYTVIGPENHHSNPSPVHSKSNWDTAREPLPCNG